MKKSILPAAVLFLFAAGNLAANPRIQFEETVFDFGVLTQGATVQHSFFFKNTGGDSLEVQSVNTSCGCTAALPSERFISPGGTSHIDVSYDSKGKLGDTYKTVRVRNTDPESPIVYLIVRGLVVPSDHPEKTGTQNLFEGSCKTCHVDQGRGKTGEALYRADCAMCHENHKMGGHFIAASAEDMTVFSTKVLRRAIEKGKSGTSMPAFHTSEGGPLSGKDIKGLVQYIHQLKER